MEVEVFCVTSMLGQSGFKKTLLIQLKDGGCSFARENNSPKVAWDCSVVENMAMGWDFFMPYFTPHFSSSKFETCTGTCWAIIFLGSTLHKKQIRHITISVLQPEWKFPNNSKSYLACDKPGKMDLNVSILGRIRMWWNRRVRPLHFLSAEHKLRHSSSGTPFRTRPCWGTVRKSWKLFSSHT